MSKKIEKISLFPSKNSTKSNKNKKHKISPKATIKKTSLPKELIKADKLYRKLQRKGIAQSNHIFQGGSACNSIALDYVDNIPVLDTTLKAICKRANETKPHHYYHYYKHHFYEYNAWILSQILTESGRKNEKKK